MSTIKTNKYNIKLVFIHSHVMVDRLLNHSIFPIKLFNFQVLFFNVFKMANHEISNPVL